MTKLLVAVLAVAGALNVMAAYVVQPLGTVEQVTEAAAAGGRVLNMDKTSPPMPTDFKGMVKAVGVARDAVEPKPIITLEDAFIAVDDEVERFNKENGIKKKHPAEMEETIKIALAEATEAANRLTAAAEARGEPDPGLAMDYIVGAAAARAVTKKTMVRTQGEMIAAIETDKAGNKIARIVKDDGSTEVRQLRVLHTARVKEPVEERDPIGRTAGGAAAGLAAGAGLALAGKKLFEKAGKTS